MYSIVGIEDGLTEAPVASSSYGIVAAKDDVQADRDAAIDCGKASRDKIALSIFYRFWTLTEPFTPDTGTVSRVS